MGRPDRATAVTDMTDPSKPLTVYHNILREVLGPLRDSDLT